MLMFGDNSFLEEKCGEYNDLKFWMQFIQLGITIFITGCTAISQIIVKMIITALSLKKKTNSAALNFVY